VIRDLRMDGVIDTAMLFHMGYGIALTQKRADFYKGIWNRRAICNFNE
jgi:hypothetical protein